MLWIEEYFFFFKWPVIRRFWEDIIRSFYSITTSIEFPGLPRFVFKKNSRHDIIFLYSNNSDGPHFFFGVWSTMRKDGGGSKIWNLWSCFGSRSIFFFSNDPSSVDSGKTSFDLLNRWILSVFLLTFSAKAYFFLILNVSPYISPFLEI